MAPPWWRCSRGSPRASATCTARSPTRWPGAAWATAAARGWPSSATRSSFLGGVRHGVTQGGPLAVQVGNTEWPKWETVMAPDPVDAEALGRPARDAPLTRPRPGHADLVGMQKYGFDDARPVLERASARETAARVALGPVARAFLAPGLWHLGAQPCREHREGGGRGGHAATPPLTTWRSSTRARSGCSTQRPPPPP